MMRMTKYGDYISGGARRRRACARPKVIGFFRHFELSFYHITPAVQRSRGQFQSSYNCASRRAAS